MQPSFFPPFFAVQTPENFTSSWFKTVQCKNLDLVEQWRRKQRVLKNSHKKQTNRTGNLLKKIIAGFRICFFLCVFTSVPNVPVHVDLMKQIKICHIHFKSNVNHSLSLINYFWTCMYCRATIFNNMNIALTSSSPPPIQCWFLFMQQCDNIPNFWGEGGKIE